MRYFLIFLLILLFVTTATGQDEEHRIFNGTGFSIDLPPGWIPVKSSEMETIIRSDRNNNVRLSILRFEIEKENQLRSRSDIIEAIEGLYDQLGIDSSAYNKIDLVMEPDRASFSINYSEAGRSESSMIDVILKGFIVRSKDSDQIFFLLRGYKPAEIETLLADDLTQTMGSFVISLPLADSLFPTKSGYGMLILFFAIALMAFFYIRNRKVQSSRNPLGKDSRFFWRCPECRLANHIEHIKCQRCGAERILEKRPR